MLRHIEKRSFAYIIIHFKTEILFFRAKMLLLQKFNAYTNYDTVNDWLRQGCRNLQRKEN